jgi:hypothetical protein
MMRSVTGGVVAAVLATTMLAPPAHAEYYSIDDPADAKASRTDVYGMRVRHGAEEVNVAVTFADLRRSSLAGISIYFDTVKSRRGPEFVLSSGLGDGTDYALTRAWRWRSRGEHVDCDYLARVKWGVDRFRTLLDRDCFGDPDQIRVSVRMSDHVDSSHPVIDWVPERRRWSLWLGQGA